MKKNNEIRILCENIKSLRSICKMSKKEIASKLGISVASLTKLENGILPPQLNCDFLFQIYRNFGITPAQMFQSLSEITPQ